VERIHSQPNPNPELIEISVSFHLIGHKSRYISTELCISYIDRAAKERKTMSKVSLMRCILITEHTVS
jgi:hypothetical protein